MIGALAVLIMVLYPDLWQQIMASDARWLFVACIIVDIIVRFATRRADPYGNVYMPMRRRP
ncbi:MAG: hypothetical protein EHM35_00590 [Planctomycetaceae bacterium]|nr:MAG: hypothetical protein EHM35_00590 [Planctomycetaceae bacterium]